MKLHVWIFALLLTAAPAFAQDPEEALRELGMGGIFASGDLALRDVDRNNDPVQQLKRFFTEAKLPLAPNQERSLETVIADQRKAQQANAKTPGSMGRLNQEFMKKVNAVLTPEQAAEWKRFRTEQIMLRGGYPAL